MKKELELDGIYFRVEREGIDRTLCFTDMTDDEIRKVLEKKSPEWITELLKMLINILKDICQCAGVEIEDPIINQNQDVDYYIKYSIDLANQIYKLGEKYDIRLE